MTSRRQLLKIGITAPAWPLAAGTAGAGSLGFGGHEPLPLYRVVYDTRFEAAREFAGRARQLGLTTEAITGDMTRFWYDDLYHEWQRGPVAIGGLTAHGALFCFDQLGRDQGLRVVFRAEHAAAMDGTVEHALEGPEAMLAEHERQLRDGAAWSRSMADVVAQCPRGGTEIVRRVARSKADGRLSRAVDDGRLYTWVLAPARRG